MRVIIVSSGYYPDHYHINQLVQDLAKRGHQITVLTGQPDYATGVVPSEYKWLRKHHEQIGLVEVFRCPVISRRKGPVMRFFSYLSFMVTGSLFALFHTFKPFDVIYVWGISPITAAVPAIILKKRTQKPLFYYCLDLWPESMKAFRVGEHNPLFKLVGVFTRWIYSQFDWVGVTSKPFIEYIHTENKYPQDKITYLPQYGAEEYLAKDFSPIDNGIIDYVFAGNIGYVQDIDKLIEAVALLKDVANIQVHIVGDGSAKQQLEALAQSKGLGNKVIFHGRVRPEEVGKYYQLADACLLTLNGESKIGETLPVKMQGYMAAGKAVIAAINGAGKAVIEESGCGLVVKAGDVVGLARIMREFATNKEKYAQCGANGREYFKAHFTKEEHLTRLEQLLSSLVSTHSPIDTEAVG